MFSNCCLMQKYSCFSLIRAYLSHLQKPRAVNPALTWKCYLWSKWKGREGRGAAWGSPSPWWAHAGVRWNVAPGALQWHPGGAGGLREWQKWGKAAKRLQWAEIRQGSRRLPRHLLCMFGGLGWKSFPLADAGMLCWWISSVQGGLTPGELR